MMVLYALVPLALAAAAAAALRWGLHLGLLWSWLASISPVTFLAYAYDKAAARSRRTRVPEDVLLLLAGLGGTPGAIACMWLLHHKTSKGGFQLRFWLVVAIQVVLVVSYFIWGRPWFLEG